MPKLFVLILAVPLLTGCARVDDDAERVDATGALQVVATTGMIADAAQRVGGRRVEVRALMGPGIDPHVYKASEGDVELLVSADVVLFNGLHLESRLADVLARLGTRAAAVTDALPRSRLLAPPEFQGQYDPHVWFDVRLWADVVRETAEVLARRDPEGRELYRRNAARYTGDLLSLDAWVRQAVDRVPERSRVLVTAHDAFNYFGRAYGFDVRGLQGISTATEAGSGDVRALADLIAERQIPALFVETSVSPRAIEAVRAAVRSRGFETHVGEGLFSDAMGDPGTPEGTYVGMVRHNVQAIVSGLLGERP